MNAWSLLSKMWKYICLPRSERKAPNKRGLEQSSVRGHMEDPGFISQHHTSLEDDGHFQGRLTGIFRGTKSGISTCQESENEWEIPYVGRAEGLTRGKDWRPLVFSKCLFRDRLPLEEASLAWMLELKVRAPLQAFWCFSRCPVQSQCPWASENGGGAEFGSFPQLPWLLC